MCALSSVGLSSLRDGWAKYEERKSTWCFRFQSKYWNNMKFQTQVYRLNFIYQKGTKTSQRWIMYAANSNSKSLKFQCKISLQIYEYFYGWQWRVLSKVFQGDAKTFKNLAVSLLRFALANQSYVYWLHCVKSVQIQSFFWSVFSEYRKIKTRKKSAFGHFSRWVHLTGVYLVLCIIGSD